MGLVNRKAADSGTYALRPGCAGSGKTWIWHLGSSLGPANRAWDDLAILQGLRDSSTVRGQQRADEQAFVGVFQFLGVGQHAAPLAATVLAMEQAQYVAGDVAHAAAVL